jgi:hypothetical protein
MTTPQAQRVADDGEQSEASDRRILRCAAFPHCLLTVVGAAS